MGACCGCEYLYLFASCILVQYRIGLLKTKTFSVEFVSVLPELPGGIYMSVETDKYMCTWLLRYMYKKILFRSLVRNYYLLVDGKLKVSMIGRFNNSCKLHCVILNPKPWKFLFFDKSKPWKFVFSIKYIPSHQHEFHV